MASKKKTPGSDAAHKLGSEKLASSGLDIKDAAALGMEILTGFATAALHAQFKPLPTLCINYYDVHGKPLPDWPGGAPFYRLRYLELPPAFDGQKPVRYVQPPETVPVAYYPKTVDWAKLVNDVDAPLIITEGELKAAKACREGFPTIGLGGVYNWRALKKGITWLPSLEPVKWVRRHVYICFDSDYRDNPAVCNALKALADELEARGAFVHLVALPSLEGMEKTGLDDFLTFAGPSATEMFRNLLTEAEPLGLTQALWAFNSRYVYVQNPGLVIDQASKFKVAPSAFRDHLAATATYQEKQLRPDGSISYKAVSAAATWLRWPLRQEVVKLTYKPGAERFIQSPVPAFNIWTGWGVEPKKGNVKPFLELVDYLFTNAEPEAKRWFLCWCAHPLQNPGAKLFSSVVIHGVRHGTGKSLLGYTLGRIYGANFTEISQMDLHNQFNEWAEAKQFILGDDVTGSNKRADADFLKKLITQREIRINGKYVPTYTVPDCVNYFFTANHPDSFFLEDDDRRFFVHEVQVPPLPQEFYMDYDVWVDSGGSSALFHYLLNLDLGDFNAAAPAFRTMAKERMIVNVRSDLAGWVRTLLATPDAVLKLGEMKVQRDLFTTKELLAFYDVEGRTGTTANGLGRELARAGVRQACDGRPVRLPDGSQARYYIIRNQEHWAGAQPKAVMMHLTEHKKAAEAVKTKAKKY